MPIRINLKELFGSDSQSVTIEKLNFNFNKLLELGIGLPGEKGSSGPQGGAGPVGLVGPQGEDGNYWFVGSGDPNGQTFTDLDDEDFFIDTVNSSIWQYDSTSDTWNLIVDLQDVVNNYLTTSGVTFIRGLGEGSPDDERYILFPNRGNTVSDQTTDQLGGSSNNDIFFLNNFNEKLSVVDIANFPSATNDLYNAIQKVYVDFTLGIPGRYHMEMGSLYQDTIGTLDNYLTDLKHNLKFRHTVDDLGGASNFPSTNDYIFVGKATMSKPELTPITAIDYNSVYETIVTKYNNEGGSPIRGELTYRLGSREGIGEYFTGTTVDGLTIDLGGLSGKAALGIGVSFENNLTSIDGSDYFVLETDGSLDGILLNNATYQDGGNIDQLGSKGGSEKSDIASVSAVTNGVYSFGNQGIISMGNRIWTVVGTNPYYNGGAKMDLNDSSLKGSLTHYNVQTDHNSPALIKNFNGTGLSSSLSAGLPGDCVPQWQHAGAGLCDLAGSGKYIFGISNQSSYDAAEVIGVPDSWRYSNLQIWKTRIDSRGVDEITRVINLSASDIAGLDGAWRVECKGSRLVVVNNYLRSFAADTIAGSNMNADGYISIIDVTDPSSPTLEADEFSVGRHFLDLKLYEEHAITLTLEFGAITGGRFGSSLFAAGYDIKVQVWNIEGTLELVAESTIYSTATVIGEGNYITAINRFGSVECDGENIYAVWEDSLYTFQYDSLTWCGRGATLPVSLGAISTYQYTTSSQVRSFDIKCNGESIYVLYGIGNSGYTSPVTTEVAKINTTSVSFPYTVWNQEMTENGGARMCVLGNNLYINCLESKGNILVPIELDGVNSDHGRISSLRSDNLTVTNSLNVGENAKINDSLNVGAGGIYVDQGRGIQVDGPVGSTGDITSSGDISADNISSTDTISAGTSLSAGTSVSAGTSLSAGTSISAGTDISATGKINIGTGLDGDIQNGTSASPSSTQVTATLDSNVVQSGVYGSIGANYSSGSLTWQRIGNIVHVSGQINRSGTSSGVGLLPHNNCSNVTGQATSAGKSYLISQQGSDPASQFDINDTSVMGNFPGSGDNVHVSICYELV